MPVTPASRHNPSNIKQFPDYDKDPLAVVVASRKKLKRGQTNKTIRRQTRSIEELSPKGLNYRSLISPHVPHKLPT